MDSGVEILISCGGGADPGAESLGRRCGGTTDRGGPGGEDGRRDGRCASSARVEELREEENGRRRGGGGARTEKGANGLDGLGLDDKVDLVGWLPVLTMI